MKSSSVSEATESVCGKHLLSVSAGNQKISITNKWRKSSGQSELSGAGCLYMRTWTPCKLSQRPDTSAGSCEEHEHQHVYGTGQLVESGSMLGNRVLLRVVAQRSDTLLRLQHGWEFQKNMDKNTDNLKMLKAGLEQRTKHYSSKNN